MMSMTCMTSNVISQTVEYIMSRVMQKIVAYQLRENRNVTRWSQAMIRNLLSLENQSQQKNTPQQGMIQDEEAKRLNFKIKTSFQRKSSFLRSSSEQNQNRRLSLPTKKETKLEENAENDQSEKKVGSLQPVFLRSIKKVKSMKTVKIEQIEIDEINNEKEILYRYKKASKSFEAKQFSKQKELIKPSSLSYKIGLQRKCKLKYSYSPDLKLTIKKVVGEESSQKTSSPQTQYAKPVKMGYTSKNICLKYYDSINQPNSKKIILRNQPEPQEKKKLIVSQPSNNNKNKKSIIHIFNKDKVDEMFLETCLHKVLNQVYDQQPSS